ncbi:RWD domain-containing protein 3 isoform X2 [Megalops cyprinoides]|uniref:RWD domain-containing protein 3 isoform X2 n=1 Tax=Megalops cyprinoides TaxID=118141 RepID=UPI001865472E|nr:RWD domain-containing protein 3 isoform X2 [Megalops cyprinoides]
MSETALDEASVLSAIYCEKDEFALLEESDEKGLVFRIQVAVGTGSEETRLSLVFHLPPEYPRCLPDVSVSSERLSRRQCQRLRRSLLEKAAELLPEPVVHELILWLRQNPAAVARAEPSAGPGRPAGDCARAEEGAEIWTALLLLDHMRAKTKYVKIIEKWTSELGLTGRLFMGKLILILLQGPRRSIKEYLHLQKTVKVDVDSAGKKCKEKMMSVLSEAPLSDEHKQLRPASLLSRVDLKADSF